MIYRPAAYEAPGFEVIQPTSNESLGANVFKVSGATLGSMTWVANLAVFIPFGVSAPFLVREMFWKNGSVAGANIDVGLYDTAGNLLASLGSTAQGLASGYVTSSTFTDYLLAPGDYYMALSCNGTTNTIGGWAPLVGAIAATWGVGQMATAFPLPNPATIVPLTNALVPVVGINGSTVNA